MKKYQLSAKTKTASALLGPMVRILSASGMTGPEILGVVQNELASPACRRAKRLRLIQHDTRLEEVIRLWRTERPFASSGSPMPLTLNGPQAAFRHLVRRASARLDASVVYRKLLELKVIKKDRNGRVHLLREFLPFRSGSHVNLELAALITADYLRALEVDLLSRRRPGRGMFLRAAQNYEVDRRVVTKFDRFVRTQGSLLLESVEDWLERRTVSRRRLDRARNGKPVRLGLGMYVINEGFR